MADISMDWRFAPTPKEIFAMITAVIETMDSDAQFKLSTSKATAKTSFGFNVKEMRIVRYDNSVSLDLYLWPFPLLVLSSP